MFESLSRNGILQSLNMMDLN
ncbi:hypothetical protein Goari_001442, partial [Gossypium aridum]|nr:hypothetical protein [Gossypium aridum]